MIYYTISASLIYYYTLSVKIDSFLISFHSFLSRSKASLFVFFIGRLFCNMKVTKIYIPFFLNIFFYHTPDIFFFSTKNIVIIVLVKQPKEILVEGYMKKRSERNKFLIQINNLSKYIHAIFDFKKKQNKKKFEVGLKYVFKMNKRG